jgi:hypothetical protein
MHQFLTLDRFDPTVGDRHEGASGDQGLHHVFVIVMEIVRSSWTVAVFEQTPRLIMVLLFSGAPWRARGAQTSLVGEMRCYEPDSDRSSAPARDR